MIFRKAGDDVADVRLSVRLEAVFAIQIAILLIGLFQDYALGLAKKFLFPYADLQLEKR